MYVLEYLRDPKCEKNPKDSLTSQYRLLCSGTIYRDVIGDPFKSEVARILLDEPLMLFVASRPFDDYPLEMVLELTVPQVEEVEQVRSVQTIHTFHPDDEVAKDIAALLSLICRRLITVAGKASEQHSDYLHPLFGPRPFPMPLATSMSRICWRPHPFSILTSLEGQKIRDYNPRPKALNPGRLTALLTGLPPLEYAKSIVASCRLYALALELIHERPDISYQLLISSVETMANAALASFQPSDDVKVDHKNAVYKLAVSIGLEEKVARQLTIEACKGEYWATKKFKKFLMDNVADSVWTEQDELFHQMSNDILPKREDFEQILGKIYKARSKATHVGQPFPITASYTGGPTINVRAANKFYSDDGAFPPVVWFERIVQSALLRIWDRSISALHPPSPNATPSSGAADKKKEVKNPDGAGPAKNTETV